MNLLRVQISQASSLLASWKLPQHPVPLQALLRPPVRRQLPATQVQPLQDLQHRFNRGHAPGKRRSWLRTLHRRLRPWTLGLSDTWQARGGWTPLARLGRALRLGLVARAQIHFERISSITRLTSPWRVGKTHHETAGLEDAPASRSSPTQRVRRFSALSFFSQV